MDDNWYKIASVIIALLGVILIPIVLWLAGSVSARIQRIEEAVDRLEGSAGNRVARDDFEMRMNGLSQRIESLSNVIMRHFRDP